MKSFLETPIEYLKGVGPQRAEVLRKEFEVQTFNDLLRYLPFRYVDRSEVHQIKDINIHTQYIQLRGVITGFRMMGEKRGKRLLATFRDKSDEIDLVWFKGIDWVTKTLKTNTEYVVFGKPTLYNTQFNIAHPEVEAVKEMANGGFAKGLQPVYNTSELAKKRYLDSRAVAKLTQTLTEQLNDSVMPDFMPASWLAKNKMPARSFAYRHIHFPENEATLHAAQQRVKFDELFLIQLRMLRIRQLRNETSRGFVFEKVDDVFDRFYKNHLPFELTNAQKRVLKEIRRDTMSGKQMNRLLQGDVGSGKTIVAVLTMLMALDNGYQACLMAPTEILAQQHFISISDTLRPLGIQVMLLTGSTKKKERTNILQNLEEGKIKIVVGTHALLEDEVRFCKLGMVVIDEQHRFGVGQRARLWKKSQQPPHVLIMTATPIPRTLAKTVYGDLDLSIIDELPPGRKAIRTVHRTDAHRLKVFEFIKAEIAAGRQIYMVYPLIEESEKSDLKDLMDGFESISRAFPRPQYQISIVHGRMRPQDKDLEMQRFVRGETQIMVATTVIEVGVNVPNASVMVIENAERFGLSQLHQLRGRVGRGAEQSYCILMTKHKLGEDSKQRIEVMCRTNDGFEIAETDLRLRGPGDLDGTKQSGALDLRLADLASDGSLLELARNTAEEILQHDPSLEKPANRALKNFVEENLKDKVWSKIS